MKKAILLICIIVSLMFIPAHIHAQIEQQQISFRPFYLLSLQPDEEVNILSSAFLDNINEGNGIYKDSWSNKIGKGAINTITSWTEIPREVVTVSGEQNLVAGFTLGFGKGVVSSLARTASGIFDMTTFGVPPYDKPAMEPKYKVKEPQGGLKIALLEW